MSDRAPCDSRKWKWSVHECSIAQFLFSGEFVDLGVRDDVGEVWRLGGGRSLGRRWPELWCMCTCHWVVSVDRI